MPRIYVEPTEGTRDIEFWLGNKPNGYTRRIKVPEHWTDTHIEKELIDWCGQFEFWHSFHNFITYGWNDPDDFGKREWVG